MTHSNINFKANVIALLALTAASWANAACYTVYDSKNQVIYRNVASPVDLSKPLHETRKDLPAGSHLVFTPNNNVCIVEVNELPGNISMPSANANAVTSQLNLGTMVTVR